VQTLLFPTLSDAECAQNTEGKCVAMVGPNRLRVAGDTVKLEGPLAVGATIAENILLEYAEGLAPADVGWGRAATPEAVAAMMPLHDLYADLMRRTRYFASRHGALLARTIVDTLTDSPETGVAGTPPIPRSAQFVAFIGHDTNLSNIAGLLDVDWALPGQPDKTAPDTVMAFEIWQRPADHQRFVRLVIHYQTLAQLRDAGSASADSRQAETLPVPVPGCSDGPDGLCRLESVANRLAHAIEPSCLR
jgi:4-phytase/acid phosphatase